MYQNIIQEGSKQHKIVVETLWKNLLPKLDFQQIRKNMYKSYAQPYCTDLHYRLLNYSTKTNEYMHKCTKDINLKCNYCQNAENNIHLFTECPRIKKIWTYYQRKITQLIGKNYKPQLQILTLSTNNLNKHTTKLILTIIQIILHEIWTSRNNYKYDNTLIPQYTIITKINAKIENIINTHYKNHKLNGRLDVFKQLFCINHGIAKIENNLLKIII